MPRKTVKKSGIRIINRNVIKNFDATGHDLIDLHHLAANLHFLGTGAFTGAAHEVNYAITGSGTV